MLKSRFLSIAAVWVLALSGAACTTMPEQVKPAPEAGAPMSAEEQDKKALEIFQKIFKILEDGTRAEAIPQVERMYQEIIDNYPRAALVQECYWRLNFIYLNDYTPPAYDKAETHYQRFVALFPESPFRREIEDALASSYYRKGEWGRLLKFYTPAIRRYVEKGTVPTPKEMFMYAEAKFRLGDLVEADKGYRIVIALFPKSTESARASERLEEIRKTESK